MPAATASQRCQSRAFSGMDALLPRTLEVRDAAAAERRVAAIGTDVVAPVPAALAFRGAAGRHGDLQLGRFANVDLRRDERELEVLAQRAQEREILAARAHDHLGLER